MIHLDYFFMQVIPEKYYYWFTFPIKWVRLEQFYIQINILAIFFVEERDSDEHNFTSSFK